MLVKVLEVLCMIFCHFIYWRPHLLKFLLHSLLNFLPSNHFCALPTPFWTLSREICIYYWNRCVMGLKRRFSCLFPWWHTVVITLVRFICITRYNLVLFGFFRVSWRTTCWLFYDGEWSGWFYTLIIILASSGVPQCNFTCLLGRYVWVETITSLVIESLDIPCY